MKKIFLLIILMAVFTNLQVKAQTEKKNIIKINYLSPIISTFSAFYEREVSDMISIQLGGFYTNYQFLDIKLNGFGITPEMRIYLSNKTAPEGFFIAPFFRYQDFTLEDEITTSRGKLTTIGGGLLFGGQWVFKDIISIDVWGGPSFASGDVEHTERNGSLKDIEVEAVSGFGFRFGTTVGLGF